MTDVRRPHADPRTADPQGEGGRDRRSSAAVVVCVVLWASAFVVIRDAGRDLSPAPMALLRVAVAATVLGVVVAARRVRGVAPRVRRGGGRLVVAYGVLWFAAYTVALNAGERSVDAGTAAMLVSLAPLLVTLGAGRFLGEGYPVPLLVGSAVAFGGVVLIASDGSGRHDGVGVALCVLAAVLYAVSVPIQKVALRFTDGLTAIWLGCVVGTAALGPWAPQLVAELRDASPSAIGGTVYSGVFPTAIGFTAWAYALRRMAAGRLTATTYAVPAVSVLLSWLLLSEVPTPVAALGGALCLVGVAVSRRRDRRPRRRTAPGRTLSADPPRTASAPPPRG